MLRSFAGPLELPSGFIEDMLYAYTQFGAAVCVQRWCNDARMLWLDLSDKLCWVAILLRT